MQYTCPVCGLTGTKPDAQPRPRCHRCEHRVEMMPSYNGIIHEPLDRLVSPEWKRKMMSKNGFGVLSKHDKNLIRRLIDAELNRRPTDGSESEDSVQEGSVRRR